MFPLVHYFVNQKICETVPHLTALGGVFPDLAAGAGFDRNAAHTMGRDFHAWCRANAPEGLPLAWGIISHGTEPQGVDYYADEHWPGYCKGWCFLQGEPYMAQAAAITHLPEDLLWWKCHNFVEISYELLTEEKYPCVRTRLLAAISDEAAIDQAAHILGDYCRISPEKLAAVFRRIPDIFAIKELNPLALAEKQNAAFRTRHQVYDADVPAMAELFTQIQQAMRPGYDRFFDRVIAATRLLWESYR